MGSASQLISQIANCSAAMSRALAIFSRVAFLTGSLASCLGVGALRNAEAARNFCLGDAEVFAPGADGRHVLVDDFVDHSVGESWRILFGQAHVFRVETHDECGLPLAYLYSRNGFSAA